MPHPVNLYVGLGTLTPIMDPRLSSKSLYLAVQPDEALYIEVQRWKRIAKEKPLKFFVVGRGGVGKSALVNHLLELDREKDGAKEGFTGNATTQAVRSYTGSKHDMQVIAYDTPGLQDFRLRDEDTIKQLVDTTDSTVDVCLYCASLETRVSQEDRRICSLLTNAFKPTLWEKAIFVLTFANSERVVCSDYEALIDRFKDNLKDCLKVREFLLIK